MDYATMQSILGWAAIAAALAAGGIVGAMLVYDLGRPLWRRLARLWRRSPVECVAAVALLCYCVAWGGGKITFPRTNAEYELLKDAGSFILTAGETTTNKYYDVAFDYDLLAIRFTAHPILPETADIQVWRRPASSTNDADWVVFDDKRTLANYRDGDECALDISLAAHTATNYNWMVFTTWQPAPAVQTNGVININWLLASTNDAQGAANAADEIAATPIRTQITIARDAADAAAEMTEPEAYAAFAPDTALLVDLSLIGTNTITHTFATRGEAGYEKETATIWWGDGTQTDIRAGYYGTSASHTYPSAKGRYVLRISNLSHCSAFGEMRSSMMRNAVVRVLRWGDGPFVGSCVNCVNLTEFPDGRLARWPAGTTTLSDIYQNCTSLAATELPDWPKGLTLCRYVYMGDTKIAATKFPKWPETLVTIGSSGYGGVYLGCSGIRATEFPEWPKGAKAIGPAYHGCSGVKATRIPAWPEGLENLPSEYGQGVYGKCTGLVARLDPVTNAWPQSLASANATYYGCTSLTGSIPAWPTNAAFASANATYYGCTSLTGSIPAWPTNAAFASANDTYNGCSSLTGAWTDAPDELMPAHIKSHSYTVGGASAALRALFYSSWGGTRKEGE